MKKNVASQVIGVQMASATDGSAFTGTVTVYVTGDGGTQALGSVGSGVCTHEGNGFHTYAPAQAETNYDHIGFTFIGTGAIPSTLQVYTAFPQTVDNDTKLSTLLTRIVGTIATGTHTAQTGDTYALANGAAGFVAIDTVVDTLLTRIVGTLAAGTHNPASTAQLGVLTDWIDGNRLDLLLDAIKVVTDAQTAITPAALVDLVWDEVLTGLTHNVVSSAGRRLRSIQEFQGYEGGHVWIDGVNGTAGTTDYENGTVENPVDAPAGSIADANTIAAAVGLSRFAVAPNTSITFAASQANQIFEGHEWSLALGGQAVTSSMFIDANVSGTGTGTESEWDTCIFGITSLPAMQAYNCSFTATTSGGFTMSAAGDYRFINCQSGVAGSGAPLFTLGTGAITAEFRRWSGGITFAGITSDDVLTISGELGTVDLGSPSGAADIQIRGTYKAITNIGSATVNTDGAILAADVADMKSGIIYGSAATGTLSTTVATTDLTGYADDQLIGAVIVWLSGDCEGERTDITDYANTNGQLTFTALTTAPANGDLFKIV